MGIVKVIGSSTLTYLLVQIPRSFLEVCSNRYVLNFRNVSYFVTPGERKSPYVALCCVVMAFAVLFGS